MIVVINRLKLIILCALLAFIALNPSSAIKGAAAGIELCVKAIIPSMLPFMVIVQVLRNSGLYFPPMIGGFLCGFPNGAIMTQELYNVGKIKKDRFQKLAVISNNASIGFVFAAVGIGIYHSIKVGWLLFGAQVITALIMGLFLGLRKSERPSIIKETSKVNAFRAISIYLAIVCTTVIFFSSIIYILNSLHIPFFLTSLIEITNGIAFVPPLPFAAFLLGFGGFATAAQTFAVCSSLNKKQYIFLKLLQGIICGFLVYLAEIILHFI